MLVAAYSLRHHLVPPTGVSVSGTVTIGGTLTCAAVGATSYQWQRSATFEGGGGWSNIGGATSSTYAPVKADIGYDLRCIASNGAGSTTSSNTLRYIPVNVTAVFDHLRIRALTPGLIATLTGLKAGIPFTASGANRPTASQTNFPGSFPGLHFTSDQMDGAIDLSAYSALRVVMAMQDNQIDSQLSILLEYTSVFTNAGSFCIGTNIDGTNTGTIDVISHGTGSFGGVRVSEKLASACVMSFGFDTHNANGAAFIRKNGTGLTTTNIGTGSVAGNFANDSLHLGARVSGGGPWTDGYIGGEILILTGNAVDGDLADAEAFCANGSGL